MNAIRSRWALGSLVFFSMGLIVGSWTDHTPERPEVRRAGYRVVQGDFHLHTRYSDGVLFPMDVVWVAERSGLDVISITEHNTAWPGRMAAWFSELVGGPLVLVGQEVTTHRFHLIGTGLRHSVSWDRDLSEVIDEIHEQGGVAIAAHPGRMYWDAYDRVLAQLDAAEVVHPAVYLGRREGALSYEEMVTFYEARRGQLAAIGSSDYHAFKALGVCRTLLFVDTLSREGVLDAIRARRTVTYAPDGRAFGDADLIAALERSPVEIPSVTSYAVGGGLDLFGRVMGLLGLVGFVFVASPLYESRTFHSSSNARQNGATSSS